MAQFPGARNKRPVSAEAPGTIAVTGAGNDLLQHFDVLGYPAYRVGIAGARGGPRASSRLKSADAGAHTGPYDGVPNKPGT